MTAARPGSEDRRDLWTFSDAHVGTDASHGRRSLADSIRHSERGGDEGGPPFDWDLALDLGDMSGGQEPPWYEPAERRLPLASSFRRGPVPHGDSG